MHLCADELAWLATAINALIVGAAWCRAWLRGRR